MTKVVRHPQGKARPRNAPEKTLPLRRWLSGAGETVRYHWRSFLTGREARRSITPQRNWHSWRPTFARSMRFLAYLGAVLLVAWVAESIWIAASGRATAFEKWRRSNVGIGTIDRFLSPLLVISFATAVFLLFWFNRTKKPVVRQAKRNPRALVPTAGSIMDQIVGRREIVQVIAQSLRDPATRKPYLLVGGVGVGKTAVLVELTRVLAEQHAVPVPVRLRGAGADGELDFRKLAMKRFMAETDRGIVSSGQSERVWRQLCMDDKAVVIADGLEEAVLDEAHRDERDNIIREAIRRAHQQKLPLIIASRPHAPLEGSQAAIIDMEPLSEEAALEFLMADAADPEERRLDWIVETAGVTDSPIYLQIARQLRQHGILENRTLRNDVGALNTRSHDRSTLRLGLLDAWREALVDGRLLDTLVMHPEDRALTVEVVSALACVGLLEDSLEVNFDDILGSQSSGRDAANPDGQRHPQVSERQLNRIWKALRDRVGDDERSLLTLMDPIRCRSELSRYAAAGQELGLVVAHENNVRFPHSIIQAYLGFHMLRTIGDDAEETVDEALRAPGPPRELLIALVLLSRQRASEPPLEGEPSGGSTLAARLVQAAEGRADPKALDLYAAALEVDSLTAEPMLPTIAAKLADRWQKVKGDRRTLDEAKLAVVHQFGVALREVAWKTDTRSAYEEFFAIGAQEPSYPIRLAIAQEMGAGGDAAFAMVQEHFPIVSRDPVRQYLDEAEHLRDERHRANRKWLSGLDGQGAPGAHGIEGGAPARHGHQEYERHYQEQRDRHWRQFVMRAWLVPMLVGSVSEKYRDEAEERLCQWLDHLDPAKTGGHPDLPLSLENALAQGFKSAANRRRRHPGTCDEARGHLIRRAEDMLRCVRYWHAQVSLLHALCLWELPDTLGHEGEGRPDPRAQRDGSDPVRSVARWLSLAGSAYRPPAVSGAGRSGAVGLLHPFVAEAGDLVTLALETGHPERFIWIDEKGAIDSVGSHPADPEHYRKHNLWIAPSIGWTTLHPRTQRLVADVLVMLNLTERNAPPDEVEERLARANQPTLPPCITKDRDALDSEKTIGASVTTGTGRCPIACEFGLCPYPPKGEQPRAEISESFCRQQQALLRGRSRGHPNLLRRRTPAWVRIPVRELDAFWETMAARTRSSNHQDPPIY